MFIYCINSGKGGQAEHGEKGRGMNTETFERLLKQAVPDGKTIREIRIRTEKPVMILLESGENLLFSDGTCGKTESYGKKKMGSLEIREDRSVVLADQELIRGILETCSGIRCTPTSGRSARDSSQSAGDTVWESQGKRWWRTDM